MACKINNKCVNCEMCEPECPHGAISFNGQTFVIDKNLCTECKDIYPTPHCMDVCPVNCIKKEQELTNNKKSNK